MKDPKAFVTQIPQILRDKEKGLDKRVNITVVISY